MNKLALFLTLFEYTDVKISEQFDELKIVLKSETYKKLDAFTFVSALDFLNPRDKIHISFVVDEGEPVDYYSDDNSDEFLSELDGKLSVIEDEKIEITIRVIKSIIDGTISIYSYSDFLIFLKGLAIQAVFHEFNTYLRKENFLIFEYQTQETEVKTKSIWFVNLEYSGIPEKFDRISIVNKAKSSCHYNFLSKFTLLADDFLPISSNSNELDDILNRLAIIVSIVFLYDITNLQNDKLDFRLNGYKSISGTIDLRLVKNDKERQYYKIYQWVYESGNFIDKIGLARNIISLHLESVDHTDLKGDPFRSIQSSYKVYEKQNIKQYVEIRNKISDQLLSFHDRANKIIETFASGFQKSAFALITFYISAIILKMLNKDKLIEIFTIDAAVLSTAFILCSAIYYLYLIGKSKHKGKDLKIITMMLRSDIQTC